MVHLTVLRGDGDGRALRDGHDAGHCDFGVDAFEAAPARAAPPLDQGAPVEEAVQDVAGELRQIDPAGGEVAH